MTTGPAGGLRAFPDLNGTDEIDNYCQLYYNIIAIKLINNEIKQGV